MKTDKSEPCSALVINAPGIFKKPSFINWLNDTEIKFSWHKGGKPNEYSDVVVLVDPSLNGEGSDSDMPAQVWNFIIKECKKHFTPGTGNHIMVRLTNLE